MGTCALGTGGDAVVTPELRVRGMENLRVVDASVMPRIVSVNTDVTTIMIGEGTAELIRRGSWPQPSRVYRGRQLPTTAEYVDS